MKSSQHGFIPTEKGRQITVKKIYTDEEVVAKKDDIFNRLNTIRDLQEKKSRSNEIFTGDIKSNQGHVDQLRIQINTGHESEFRDSTLSYDRFKKQRVWLDNETGVENLREPMTADDFQLPMFNPAGTPAGEAKNTYVEDVPDEKENVFSDVVDESFGEEDARTPEDIFSEGVEGLGDNDPEEEDFPPKEPPVKKLGE